MLMSYLAATGDDRVNVALFGVMLLDFGVEAPLGAFQSKPVLALGTAAVREERDPAGQQTRRRSSRGCGRTTWSGTTGSTTTWRARTHRASTSLPGASTARICRDAARAVPRHFPAQPAVQTRCDDGAGQATRSEANQGRDARHGRVDRSSDAMERPATARRSCWAARALSCSAIQATSPRWSTRPAIRRRATTSARNQGPTRTAGCNRPRSAAAPGGRFGPIGH